MKIWLIVLVSAIAGLVTGVGSAYIRYYPIQGVNVETSTQNSHLAQPDADSAPPKAVVEGGIEHDFGTMNRGTKRKHTFKITNTGKSPLKIETKNTTCKCTVSSLENGTIAPGASTGVTLEWVAKSFDREFRQTATIGTNDPREPEINLSVFGKVVHAVLPIPSNLVFANLSNRESRTLNVKLLGLVSDKLLVVDHRLEIKDSADFFSVETRTMTPDELALEEDAKTGVYVAVSVKPGLPLGPIRQLLVLTTDAADANEFEIPIEGLVVGDISIVGKDFHAEQNLLKMGAVDQAVGAVANLRVLLKGEFRDQVEFTVAQVEPSDLVVVEIGDPKPFNKGAVRMIPLTLRIPPNSRLANHLGFEQSDPLKVTLSTTHPDAPKIEIRVSLAITK